MSWYGYVDAVLRPLREAKEHSDAERARTVSVLRTAADLLEKRRPKDPVAWLRNEADKLEAEQHD